MPVQFRVDAQYDRRFEGKVQQIRLNPKSEQGVVTYNVVISADNAERLLLPGMTARVDIVAARRDDVLKVANAALRYRPSEAAEAAKGKGADEQKKDAAVSARGERDRTPRVYRLRDGKVVPIDLKIGITDGRMTEVSDVVGTPEGGPLAAGDKLVVRDMQARQVGEFSISF